MFVIKLRENEYVTSGYKSHARIRVHASPNIRSARKFRTEHRAQKYIEKYFLDKSENPPAVVNVVTDMDNRVITVGDIVELHGIIGQRDENPIVGEVWLLTGMHGRPKEFMVWVKGQAAHHPQACVVRG